MNSWDALVYLMLAVLILSLALAAWQMRNDR